MLRYSRLLHAAWLRMRKEPLLWLSIVCLYIVNWMQLLLDARHLSPIYYTLPVWLGYDFYLLADTHDAMLILLCFIGALVARDAMRDAMVVEHLVRYRHYIARNFMGRVGLLACIALLLQMGNLVLVVMNQLALHKLVAPNLPVFLFNAFVYSSLHYFSFLLGGYLFTMLWRNLVIGVLAVAALHWFVMNIYYGVQALVLYPLIPHWLSYVMASMVPTNNFYRIGSISATPWQSIIIQQLHMHGSYQLGMPYGLSLKGPITYVPSLWQALLMLAFVGLCLFLFSYGIYRYSVVRNLVKGSRHKGRSVITLKRSLIVLGGGIIASLMLGVYIIGPFLNAQAPKLIDRQVQHVLGILKTSLANPNLPLNDKTIVLRSPYAALRVRDVYVSALMSSNDPVIDQGIIEGITSNATINHSLSLAYLGDKFLLADMIGFSRLYPKAWSIIRHQYISMLRNPVPVDFTEFSAAIRDALYQQGIESNSLLRARTLNDKILEYITNLAVSHYPGLTQQQALEKSGPLYTKLMYEVTMNGMRSRSLHSFSQERWEEVKR